MEEPSYKMVTIHGCAMEFISSGALTMALEALGFSGFLEDGSRLEAYIPAKDFDAPTLAAQLERLNCGGEFSVVDIAPENWNAQWESSYQPITISTPRRSLHIRANFHPSHPGDELIITPRMSFGTGHHATTRMMLQRLLELPIKGQTILDMGCGTGILSIAAGHFEAEEIIAIDIDPNAIENAASNAEMNRQARVAFILGGFERIPEQKFDVILANLTLNLLREHLPALRAHLNPGGALIVSGFFTEELPLIAKVARDAGLSQGVELSENDWCCCQFDG